MADLTSVAQVGALWRPLSTEEQAMAAELITYASAVLRRKVPDLDARMVTDPVLGDLVPRIAATMVIRAMQNPENIRQMAIGGVSWSLGLADRDAALFLTAGERELLLPVATSPPVRSVRVRAGMADRCFFPD